ncbi:MAG TPA: CPBP family intramembrane glutamic endopeptidase [Vicinamibacterales bacterium]|jgi:membrane protease YdiL (CAAX protease family)|nr:CPBP family intramembrane glutamic endopeptidase [Vicinamibacterales bacterium]
MLLKLLVGSVPVIVILVGAAFVVPSSFPLLLRQVLLCVIGVGGTMLAERLLFGPGWARVVATLGFIPPRAPAAMVAIVVSLPMWVFLPLYGRLVDVPFALTRGWLPTLLGVILVNGLAEEVIHRAFIFGHLRQNRSFWASATISAVIFAAQHLYLLFTIGAVAGVASVALALAVAFPLAFLYERGGNSLVAPAILHTSSNAPMMLFATTEAAGAVILAHMAVVLASMYLSVAFRPWLRSEGTAAPNATPHANTSA